MDVNEILDERGVKYSSNGRAGYAEVALVAQNLKSAMRHSPNWSKLPADMRESLEMVASKISRILNGDPSYLDSWVDIVGYVQLVIDRIEAQNERQSG